MLAMATTWHTQNSRSCLVCEPERVRAGRTLHTTTIRNEHAYYCCIAQLLEFHSLPMPPARALFVVGTTARARIAQLMATAD